MRTTHKMAALTLTLGFVACSKSAERNAALPTEQRHETTAGRNLDLAPQPYKRMRFVSDIEQSKGGVGITPVKSGKRAKSPPTVAPSPIATLASQQFSTVSTPQAVVSQPSIVTASVSASVPAHMITSASEGEVIDHAGESGGGWLSGVSTHVVIRGGHAGDFSASSRNDGLLSA